MHNMSVAVNRHVVACENAGVYLRHVRDKPGVLRYVGEEIAYRYRMAVIDTDLVDTACLNILDKARVDSECKIRAEQHACKNRHNHKAEYSRSCFIPALFHLPDQSLAL